MLSTINYVYPYSAQLKSESQKTQQPSSDYCVKILIFAYYRCAVIALYASTF